MRIDIIAVGKLKERYWIDACDEYLKRLNPYTRVNLDEVANRSLRVCDNDDQIRFQEAQDILRMLRPTAYTIVLDSKGGQLGSEQLAGRIASLQTGGHSHFSFVIGGSVGLDAQVRQKADLILSLGKMTLPHNLARVVLLEQLYRAFKIINGEPYHK